MSDASIKDNKVGLAKNSILYLLTMVVPNAAGFLMLPIYTRYIMPEEYGILSYTGSITGVLAVFSAMGLNAFYLRNYAVENDKKQLNGTIFWSMAAWNVLLLMIGIVAMPLVFTMLQAPFAFSPYMLLALFTQFFNSMEIIPMRTFRIRGEVQYYLIRILIKTIFSVALGLLFVVGMKLGVLGRYYAELINAFVFAIVFIVYMARNSYFSINRELMVKVLRFSLPIVPSDLVQMATPMVVTVLIEQALSLTQLGIYSIGVAIAGVVQMVTQSIFLAFEPVLYIQANSADYPSFFRRMKNNLMVTVGWFCVGCGLFAREATMLLLSEKYWTAWPIVQVLCVSYILIVLKNMYSQLNIIQGRTPMLFWSNVGYFFGSVLICVGALPLWGETALGWSNIAGFIIAFLILYAAIDKTNYRNMKLTRDFLMMTLAISTLFIGRIFHEQTVFISIIAKIFLFFAFSVVLLLMYNIHPKQIVSEVFRKRKQH